LIYKLLKDTTIQLAMNSWSGGARIPPAMITNIRMFPYYI